MFALVPLKASVPSPILNNAPAPEIAPETLRLAPEATFGMWIGAMMFWWQGRRYREPGTKGHTVWVEGYESICAGLISGSALMGIGNAIVNVLLG